MKAFFFAFIHLHKTKTSCFALEKCITAICFSTISWTKTTCFATVKGIIAD